MTTGHAGPLPIGEDDLQAWIDERLPPPRRAEVEAWLATNPEAAERVRDMAGQRLMLRSALQAKHDEPVPARLRVSHLVAARRQSRWLGMRRIAAVGGWLFLGGAMGWAGHGLVPIPGRQQPMYAQLVPRPMVAEAIAAHHVFAADLGRPVEVAAAQEALLVRWLSNRLGRPIAPPDLASLGYQLMGGRLLAGAAGDPAAQLMYQDTAGGRLTVYLRADHAGGTGTEFRYADGQSLGGVAGVAAFWWVDRGFGYAVSAEGLDRAALLRVAAAVHHQVASVPLPDRGL